MCMWEDAINRNFCSPNSMKLSVALIWLERYAIKTMKEFADFHDILELCRSRKFWLWSWGFPDSFIFPKCTFSLYPGLAMWNLSEQTLTLPQAFTRFCELFPPSRMKWRWLRSFGFSMEYSSRIETFFRGLSTWGQQLTLPRHNCEGFIRYTSIFKEIIRPEWDMVNTAESDLSLCLYLFLEDGTEFLEFTQTSSDGINQHKNTSSKWI